MSAFADSGSVRKLLKERFGFDNFRLSQELVHWRSILSPARTNERPPYGGACDRLADLGECPSTLKACETTRQFGVLLHWITRARTIHNRKYTSHKLAVKRFFSSDGGSKWVHPAATRPLEFEDEASSNRCRVARIFSSLPNQKGKKRATPTKGNLGVGPQCR